MSKAQSALRAALPVTIPVMTGYLFLGAAFGILLQSQGYGVQWALLMSLTIYAGSMQFVAVGLLAGGFSPVESLLMTLMVNARHIFYSVSMLTKYRDTGRAKPYLIFSLTDETFSLVCSQEPPEGVSPKRFYLLLSALNHLYWVTGSVVGGLAGAALTLDTTGIEFVMTALFVVIFLEQWRNINGRIPALVGIFGPLACLLLFGRQWFIIPSMVLLVLVLTLLRPTLDDPTRGGAAL